jgi:PAS domain S-box-containing protein
MKGDLQEIFRLASNYFFKKFRENGGTQRRLAMKLGVSQSYISSVLSGTRTASLELQSQIADFLYGGPYEEFLAIGRRIRNGLDPELHIEKEIDDSVESLIARLSHYVIDRKRIEGELVNMRDFYEKIVENLQSGVVVSDARDNITYINKFMEKLIGVEADRIIGTNQLVKDDRFPDRNLNALMIFYQEARNSLEPVFYENVFVITSGGNRKLLSGWMIPLQKEGAYDGMVCTIRDITRLQKLSQSLLATIEYIAHPVGLALQDYEKGPVTSFYMNWAAMQLFRIEQHSLTSEDIRVSMRKIAQMLENGEEWLMQTAINLKGIEYNAMEIIFKNGRKFTWDSRALRDDDENYCGRYVTVKEIRQDRRRGDKMKLVKG